MKGYLVSSDRAVGARQTEKLGSTDGEDGLQCAIVSFKSHNEYPEFSLWHIFVFFTILHWLSITQWNAHFSVITILLKSSNCRWYLMMMQTPSVQVHRWKVNNFSAAKSECDTDTFIII